MEAQPSLTSIIARYDGLPFVWGEFDCALFVANVLRDIHGVDFASELRGQYNSEIGSYRVLKKWGGLDGFLNETFTAMHPKFARRGDVIMVLPRTVGVCTGRYIACVSERDGIQRVPMSQAAMAWRVK